MIFVHPLRVALRLHASPSQSEGEGRPAIRLFRGGRRDCAVVGESVVVMVIRPSAGN